jgi:hypothetical protein
VSATTSLGFDIWAKDRASDKFDKVGRSADSSGGKVAKMGKLAKFGALGLAGAAVVVGKAMFDMTKAAIEDEKSQAMLAHQMRKSAGATRDDVKATEDWITAKGKSLGVADDELRPALSRLVVATKDVDKAQRLAALAMDISAAKGKPLKTVSEALAKAQEGNIGALGRLGVKTKDAEGKTRSLSDITKELAKTYEGSASKAADTTAGKFKRLSLMWDEGKESLGAKLIPVAEKAADFLLNKLGPAAAEAGAWFKEHLLPPLKEIGEFIKDKVIPAAKEFGEKVLTGLRGFIDNVGKSLKDNKPFIDALKEAFKTIATFVMDKVVPALGWVYEKTLPLLGKAIGGGITLIRSMSSTFLSLAIFGVKSFRHLLNAALSTFGGILSAAEKGMGWIPGIGDKIKRAKKAFDGFKDDTIAALDKTAAALQRTKDKVDGIPPKKNIKITVDTREAFMKLSGLKKALKDAAPPKYIAAPRDSSGHGRQSTGSDRGTSSRGVMGGSSRGASGHGGGAGEQVVVQFVLDGKVVQESLLRLKRRQGGTLGLA